MITIDEYNELPKANVGTRYRHFKMYENIGCKICYGGKQKLCSRCDKE